MKLFAAAGKDIEADDVPDTEWKGCMCSHTDEYGMY
jgi:hypothetical protein